MINFIFVQYQPLSQYYKLSKFDTIFFWSGLTLSYKGLLLLFGLFVSYETRSVKLRQINDSRYVGMSIYNVVVTCLITTPVIMVTASQQDASFAFVALSVIFCCFLSMALIFVPKVRNLTADFSRGRRQVVWLLSLICNVYKILVDNKNRLHLV